VKRVPAFLLGGLLVAAFMAVAAPAHAGVYNFAESRKLSSDDLAASARYLKFRENYLAILDVYGVAQERKTNPEARLPEGHLPLESPFLQRSLLILYLQNVDNRRGLTLVHKFNLSAYLLYMGNAAEAHDLLVDEARSHPDHFLVLANLAAALFKLQRYDAAIEVQRQALAAWPRDYGDVKDGELKKFLERGGWDPGDHDFYRRAEETFLTFIQLRAKEGPDKKYTTVDALFADREGKPLRFIDDDGGYTPGTLAKAERDKLPRGHIETIQQLLLWLPEDQRLLWLYAELLLAQGEIKSARDIFQLLPNPDKRGDSPLKMVDEYKKHRAAVMALPIPHEEVVVPSSTIDDMEKKLNDAVGPPYPWRHVTLAFFIGVAVALFAYWQFREMRRRHQKPTVS
jgi:tetratricopeptide (TPR) repeat protein